MFEEIKIPRERIAVLIGEKGETKRKIQKLTGTIIRVSSEEGDVSIEGEDSLNTMITRNIVKCIGRGFNPDVALLLLREGFTMEIINIQDFAGKSKNSEERLRSRVIGSNGKAKQTFENMTSTNISVYGKTITIIGMQEDVYLAKRGVEIILNGAPHSHAYRWIEKQKESELEYKENAV
jgi:ribosomal RNA assembly protein